VGKTFGYRRVFIAGVTIFTLSSLLCGLAPAPAVLVAGRALQGAGAALMFPQALTGIQLNFDGVERTRAIGLYAIALSAGAVVGQILGGLLISANIAGSHWRAIFVVNVPVGLAVIAAALRRMPVDAHRVARRVDSVGVAILSATLLLVVLPLVLGRAEGWPVWTWVSLAASVPGLVIFLLWERRVTEQAGSPLVNVHVLARPAVSWALLTLLVATGTYYALLFTLAQYLQAGLGRSAMVSGLTLVPWVAAFGLAGQLVGRVPDRHRAVLPVAGCVLLAAAYAAISVTLFAGQHPEALLVVVLALGGLGLGTQFSALITHLTSAVPADYAPDISGVSTTTLQIGGVFGVAVFGTVYLDQAHAGAASSTHAFAIVTAAFALAALVAAVSARLGTRPARMSSFGNDVQLELGQELTARLRRCKDRAVGGSTGRG
jgi:MFS family permease